MIVIVIIITIVIVAVVIIYEPLLSFVIIHITIIVTLTLQLLISQSFWVQKHYIIFLFSTINQVLNLILSLYILCKCWPDVHLQ